ncbi:MAG: RlmE family RNA methyltransferase [Magnetospiraceae bacterium]
MTMRGRRTAAVRVKSAKGRKLSSTRWLQRQLNDPYVQEAKRQGYRSRAAFKLLEIDEKLHVLTTGARVVDLGAAPGGWSQVAAAKVGSNGKVVALDINPMDPLAGVTVLHQDFMADDAPEKLKAALDGPADVVLSDMAAPVTGHAQTDHLRIIALCETALEFAREVLSPGGVFIAKVFQGGTEGNLLRDMKRDFQTVRHIKPPASRKESPETYVVAAGFRGESQ